MTEEKPIVNKEETFDTLEIRLGRVIAVEDARETPKPAYVIKVDFGKFGVRQTVGRFTHHTKEELKDKTVIGILNFGSRQIGVHQSEFLLLGVQYPKADSGEATPITAFMEGVKIGGKLF